MILITGADGQLGQSVQKELTSRGIPFYSTDSKTMDITHREKCIETLKAVQPEAVIHCAAFTNVNSAESQQKLCMAVNVQGSENVALACEQVGAKMIYISSDYVFDGNSADFYDPDSPANPLSVYGKSKWEGEKAVRKACQKHFIVRTSWLFGSGNNFIRTMLRLSETMDSVKVVADQFGSPTFTDDLAGILIDMALSERYGTYHATNEGFCSWYELTQEVFRCANRSTQIFPILSEEYPSPATRPLNSCLSKQCLDDNGFSRLPCWQDAVRRYLCS